MVVVLLVYPCQWLTTTTTSTVTSASTRSKREINRPTTTTSFTTPPLPLTLQLYNFANFKLGKGKKKKEKEEGERLAGKHLFSCFQSSSSFFLSIWKKVLAAAAAAAINRLVNRDCFHVIWVAAALNIIAPLHFVVVVGKFEEREKLRRRAVCHTLVNWGL